MSFEVHAGDFKQGKVHSYGGGKLVMKGDKFWPENIPFNEVKSIEVASEENVKKFGGTVGLGVAGALLLGPVGLLAGVLAGGNKKEVTCICELKDGRKFMATIPSKLYTQIQAVMFDSN